MIRLCTKGSVGRDSARRFARRARGLSPKTRVTVFVTQSSPWLRNNGSVNTLDRQFGD